MFFSFAPLGLGWLVSSFTHGLRHGLILLRSFGASGFPTTREWQVRGVHLTHCFILSGFLDSSSLCSLGIDRGIVGSCSTPSGSMGGGNFYPEFRFAHTGLLILNAFSVFSGSLPSQGWQVRDAHLARLSGRFRDSASNFWIPAYAGMTTPSRIWG